MVKMLTATIITAFISCPIIASAAPAKFNCDLKLGDGVYTNLEVQEGIMTEFDVTSTGFGSLHFGKGYVQIQTSSGVYSTDTTNIDLSSFGKYAAGSQIHFDGEVQAVSDVVGSYPVQVKLDCLPN